MLTVKASLLWFSLVASIAGSDQLYIGKKAGGRHNITLNFDNLPTNSSGIGFHPSPPKNDRLHYHGLYFQSFTVKNVAKALHELPDPIDIMCASSAPNALFATRKEGYAWPRFSLHDLSLGPDHAHDNTTFNMRALTMSPTGSIPGKTGDFLVLVTLTLMKLPPDAPYENLPPEASWPGIIRGDPGYPVGKRVYQLTGIFGPGAHESIKIDYDRFKQYWPGYAEGVDVMEVFGELLKANKKKNIWEPVGDWELCLDDVEVEIVEADTGANSAEGPEWVTISLDQDGEVRDLQEIGRSVWPARQDST